MTDIALAIANLAEREQLLILRSALHVVPDENALPEWARFHNKVTELDAARLIHAIERGYVVVPADRAWTDLRGTLRTRMPHLTRIVEECRRLRLVTTVVRATVVRDMGPDIVRVQLVAADVHLVAGPNRPACGQSGMARFRLTDDPGLIDCKACRAMDR